MTKTILLIDYENVKDTGLKHLPPHDRLQFFVGKEQKPKLAFIQGVLAKETRLDIIQVAEQGRNNLDFYIAYYLGKVMSEEPNAHYIVFSGDHDLDPLLAHLKKHGASCERLSPPKPAAQTDKKTEAAQPAVSAKPITKKTVASKTATAKTTTVRQARELLDKEKHPPKTKGKLQHRLERHFGIVDVQAAALIGGLEKEGFLKTDTEDKVKYLQRKTS